MKKEEYLRKIEQIRECDHAYYQGSPLISDYEYDMLLQSVLEIEKEHPDWQIENSPTITLKHQVDRSDILRDHGWKMLSMSNSYSKDDVEAFINRISVIQSIWPISCEHKIDGVAINARYEDGVLQWVTTRGDGTSGEDITRKVAHLFPNKISLNALCEVRGEAFIDRQEFVELNKNRSNSGKQPWMNARNLVAGSLKIKHEWLHDARKINVICYDLWTEEELLSSLLVSRELLFKEGFSIVDPIGYAMDLTSIFEFIEIGRTIGKEQVFYTDGVVLKVCDYHARNLISDTQKHHRWMIAYKYAPNIAETYVVDIILQVGRSGVICPVASLAPVQLDGSMISRCSLYNIRYVYDKDVRIGDKVDVVKGGEIIPKILNIDHHWRTNNFTVKFMWDQCCPVCHSKCVWSGNDVNVFCINEECLARKIATAIHFFGKDGLDVTGVGEEFIRSCFELNLVSDVSDFFLLTKDSLLRVDGVADNKAINIINSLQQSKARVPLYKLLTAIGIPFVGIGTAKLLANNFFDIPALQAASTEILCNIDGIGIKTAQAVVSFMNSVSFACLYDKLINEAGLHIINNNKSVSAHMKAQIVLSGKMSLSREKMQEFFEANGFVVVPRLSKSATYLVVGESPGRKINQAIKLGVNVISETDFVAKITMS